MKRFCLLLVALMAFTAYTIAVARTWRAAKYLESRTLADLERAAALEPWDPEPQRLLGQYYLYAALHPESAIAHLHTALELNPHSAGSWVDLSAAYSALRNREKSRASLQLALSIEPNSPDLIWAVANSYLAEEDLEPGLRLLRSLMDNDPASTSAAVSLEWKSTRDVDAILAYGLSKRSQPYFELLKVLAAQNQALAALKVWNALAAQNFPFAARDAFDYFDFLLATNQIDAANRMWSVLRQRSPELPERSASNMVINGGFERDLLNAGFDWRSERKEEVQVFLDRDVTHSGSRALQINFTGRSIDDTGVRQYVPVQPKRRYRFTSFVKSRDIESSSGPRLLLEDWGTHKTLAITDDPLGTTEWHKESAIFSTESETQAVLIRVVRLPGSPLIRGTYWVDDVAITPAEGAAIP